jgi:hypothetical protein
VRYTDVDERLPPERREKDRYYGDVHGRYDNRRSEP